MRLAVESQYKTSTLIPYRVLYGTTRADRYYKGVLPSETMIVEMVNRWTFG